MRFGEIGARRLSKPISKCFNPNLSMFCFYNDDVPSLSENILIAQVNFPTPVPFKIKPSLQPLGDVYEGYVFIFYADNNGRKLAG